MTRFLKACLIFARRESWVDDPKWTLEDAANLRTFLATESGQKLRAAIMNLVLRQQARALSNTTGLEYEAGYSTGQKAMASHLEAWAGTPASLTDQGDGADPGANQQAP